MKGKKAIVAALAVAAASCFLGIGAMGVGAEELPVTESYFGFETGASVRKEEPAGLRFIVNYGEEINALVTDEETALNVYIAPAEYFEKAAGDLDAVAARAVKAEIDKQTIYTKDDALYAANAVLGNVRYENINREFQAVAAIEKAGAETVYSEVSDARSIAYVASAALADETKDYTSEQKELLNTFVQKAIAHAGNVPESDFENGSYGVEIAMEESLSLEPEETVDLTATLTPAIGLYTEWTSDNEEVAVVDENGKVTAVSEGTANITAEVCGKTATCAVKVEKSKQFGLVDFSAYDVGATEIDGFEAKLGDIALHSYSVVEDEGEKVLKFEYTATEGGLWFNMIFDSAVLGDFSGFDFVDMEMKIIAEGGGGSASLGPGYNYPNGTGSQVLNYKKDQWNTYTWSLDTLMSNKVTTIAEDMKYSGRLLFTMNPWAAQKVTVYLKNITGYYAGLEIGETALDLTEEFRLSAEEFSAVFVSDDGTETPVADVTNFAPEQPGILTVSIAKQGYHPAEIVIRVTRKPDYGKLDFSDYAVGDQPDFFSASYGQGSGSYSIAEDDEGKYLKIEAQTTAINQNLIYKFAGDRFGAFGDFDYVDVTLQIAVSDNGGDGGLTGAWARYDGFASGTNYLKESNGNWVTYRWSTESILAAIKNNNSLDLYFLPWAAQSVTVGIRKIEAGWNDITSDGATAIDLAEKFGSGLTQAVYTSADGEAQTLTGESLKTFIGAESGTLKLTFEVDGYRATEFTVNYTVA